MLKNYIKIAWKVMMRRKAFTGITLAVIALYLMMITIMATLLDVALNNYPPETEKVRTLSVGRMMAYKDGAFVKMVRKVNMKFIEDYILQLETPEKIVWLGNDWMRMEKSKRNWRIKYVNAAFWELMDIEWVNGRAFSAKEIENKENVVVISESLQSHYFGDGEALGQTIEIRRGKSFTVIGVVKNIHSFSKANGNIFIPYTLSPYQNYSTSDPSGNYEVLLLGKDIGQLDEIKAEYANLFERYAYQNPEEFNELRSEARDWLYDFRQALNMPLEAIFILGSLFFLLPASSLLNINTSRILERYSEIGVRKAFGASSRVLVGQFLVENIIVSLIGGVLGFILSIALFESVKSILIQQENAVFPEQGLINWWVFIATLLFSVAYGIATGVYPAWRMSKVHPVQALKYNG